MRLALAMAGAQEAPQKAFEFIPPVVGHALFGDQVGMLDQERGEYASNLATYAGNLVVEQKADPTSLQTAKRMLAVALHLSPRNRHALVVSFQLKKGVLPPVKKSDYSVAVLSRLMLSRSRLLTQDQSKESKLLARCLVEIAATIDPRNEDAVFEFEIQRLDHGDIDWDVLFVSPKQEQETE